MASASSKRDPKYRLHKPSGQAIVTLGGRDIYLGPFGASESKQKYHRHLAEWQAHGTVPERPADAAKKAHVPAARMQRVKDVLAGYWLERKRIASAMEPLRRKKTLGRVKYSFRPVRRLYGNLPVAEFTPACLVTVREAMVKDGLGLRTINQRVQNVRRAFRWAVTMGHVSAQVWHALAAVEGLKRDETTAKPPRAVEPVTEDVVEKTLPFLPPAFRIAVQVQALTGMRSGELLAMRPADITRADGEPWRYTPVRHKNAWRGKSREVFLGPRAQALLAPLMQRPPLSFLFSPRDSEALRQRERRAKRKSDVPPSQENREHVTNPEWMPGDRYRSENYNLAIRRACKAAGVERWHPHQLRHLAASKMRKLAGLDGAQAVLGHASVQATQIYAQRNEELARKVMADVG